MSTTNKAFIKAYRQDAPQPAPARKDAGTAKEPATPPRAPAQTTTGTTSRPAERQRLGAASPPTERRPLSSYISSPQPTTQQPIEQKLVDQAHSESLQPGTTIASFQWPPVCRTLLQHSGQQLDQIVKLLFTRARAGNSLVGVLGLFPRIGATTTALCLASRAAGGGQKVILADCNLMNPRMAKLLDAVPTAGWEEVLKQTAPLADAVIHATSDHLDLLALGTSRFEDPIALVGGVPAATTAGVLRSAYDLSILDVGTFFDPTSQPILLELVLNMGLDAMVAVAGPEPADPRDVATITEHLDRAGCELLGIIENRIGKQR